MLLLLAMSLAPDAPSQGDGVLRLGYRDSWGACQVAACRSHVLATVLIATASHRRPWAEPAIELHYSVQPSQITETFATWAPEAFGGRVFDKKGLVIVCDRVPRMGYVQFGVMLSCFGE